MAPRLSLVIPALNEARYIAAALDSIHAAMHGLENQISYEVIVVDDHSSDGTADIAREHHARVLEVHKRNIAAIRNAGAREASGDILIFVDADTQLNSTLVDETLRAMRQGAIWGTALATPADRCPLWAQWGLALFNQYYVRWRRCAYGFYFFTTRQAFQDSGGFPEDTREGEDMALSKVLLQRHGRPSVLRARVATSARKTLQFGFVYHLKMLGLAIRYGDDMYTRAEIADYRDGELRAERTR